VSYLSKIIFKASSIVAENIFSYKRYFILSFVWKFKGIPKKLGKSICSRSIAGEVLIGRKVTIGPHVNIDCCKGAKIIIGENVSINQGTFIVALKEVIIGSNVLIGEYCSIRDNDHAWQDSQKLVREQGFVTASVNIGDDVWLGRGVVVSKGVKIGNGAVVGANTVVTRDVAPFTLVVGVPAHPIGRRYN